MYCQNVDMRRIWKQCRSECMCECGNCASVSPTRVRSGWKYISIPPTRDRKICEWENLHLKKKKKKKAVEYAGIYIKKETHYMRIYTRRNYLLWEKLCHGKCHLNKFSPPLPTMHDNLHKKDQPKEYTVWKRCLRAIKLDFGKSTSKTHTSVYTSIV